MAKKYTLPKLPYELNALEPVISKTIMDLHYHKHHQAYLNNLNNLLEKYEEAEKNDDLQKMIALQSGIKFNGGGYINHSIFWTNLAPISEGGGGSPTGELEKAIVQEFKSIDNFIEKFNAKTVAIQGSGWGWLGYNKENSRLEIATCANQDPLSTKGLIPLLGIDVWEHAFYIDYQNAKAKYLDAIWDIVNWSNVAERYSKAKA